jgi:phenylpropionate dioxygenase-like ring-hydroxylating dioxygenase large terminal subunit
MVSRDENRLLTLTGPGAPMGDLLRRYWIPALLSAELPAPDCPPIRVQLMGERLVAFRDSAGRVGLVEEFCAHRRVSLWFGRNEEGGLRCPYHGWKYDVTGQCVDLPSEPEETGMRKRIRLTAYPCIEAGDVIWAYMGPPELQPAPPALEWLGVPAENRFVSKRLQECNWLQALEGGIDSSHVSFLHSDLYRPGAASKTLRLSASDKAPVFEVAPFEGGLLIGARRNAEAGQYYWRVTPFIMPFYTLIPPGTYSTLDAHAWVPIDDERCWTWSISFHPDRPLTRAEIADFKGGGWIHVRYVPGTYVPEANKSNDYHLSREAQAAGKSLSGISGVSMQDASVQESQGIILDRTHENLVSTDNGIIIARRLLLQSMRGLADGKAPPGLDPASQRVRACTVELPREVAFKDGARDRLYALDQTALTLDTV